MKIGSKALRAKARAVELLVLDVDGVLTDGGLYYGTDGEALKRFDVKDGHSLVLAHHVGLKVAVLTARRSRIVERRARDLLLSPVFQGIKDKREGMKALLAQTEVEAAHAGFVGDDLNDLPAMEEVAFSACPADAAPEVRSAVHYVAAAPGGRGAVREIVELLLKAQGLWGKALVDR
jgi:3-deoxy-D-manno-octulosonate 8-phosphate phosphatase (KDO 8-P phosphatase)